MKRILLATLLAACAGPALADDCQFTARRDLDLSADGVKLLQLVTRAGDLKISGSAGAKQVEVRGHACASSAEALEMLQVRNDRNGSTLRVEGTQPESATTSWFGSNYAYIDLEIRLPAGMDIDLTDSSGDIDITNVGGIKLQDSSGDIRIADTRGDIRMSDSSGDIRVNHVEGNVTIDNDSSGDIEIDGVRRDVTIHNDSSGDIELENIDGNATVDHDSSGSIRFRRIGGSAAVGTDSSGTIDAGDVKGDFTVRKKSGGRSNIEYHDIGGKVSIPEHD